jgi:DNA-directed RNA polymerase specialized sigma24 family protein
MHGSLEPADGDLLAAVVGGDGQAFATFYRRHLSAVVAFLLRETRDREATADLTAEVFAAVFLFARRFRARGAGSARPWVLGIARNKLLESVSRGLSRLRQRMTGGER